MAAELKQHKQAFTLVETILYISIASTVTILISGMIVGLFQIRSRNQVIAEVTTQGALVIEHFQTAMNSASSITSPAIGAAGTTLSLQTTIPATNPTSIGLSSGRVQLTENTTNTLVSSNTVTITNLQFSNLGKVGTRGSILIQFTVTYNNPSGRDAFNYSQTFYATKTLQ